MTTRPRYHDDEEQTQFMCGHCYKPFPIEENAGAYEPCCYNLLCRECMDRATRPDEDEEAV